MARFLGMEELGGNKVEAYYANGKTCSSAVSIFVLERWVELIKLGFCSANYFPNLVEQRIIYLEILGKVVASLVFKVESGTSYLEFVVTHPEYRKTGLYKVLHRFYDKIAKDEGIRITRSQLHVNNENVVQAATKNGFSIEYYRMVKRHK